MIQNRRIAACVIALAAMVAAPGCREQAKEKVDGSPKDVAVAPRHAPAAPKAAVVGPDLPVAAAPAPVQSTEQPAAVRPDAPVILGKKDVMVAGKPSCEISVQYPGDDPRPVTWNGDGCVAISVSIMDAARIDALGHPERLNEENRDDIARVGGALYVESKASSALYPLNVFKRTYQVPLAD